MPTTLRPLAGPSLPTPSPARKGNDVALLAFILLVLLGVIAVGISFARM